MAPRTRTSGRDRVHRDQQRPRAGFLPLAPERLRAPVASDRRGHYGLRLVYWPGLALSVAADSYFLSVLSAAFFFALSAFFGGSGGFFRRSSSGRNIASYL